MRIFWGGRTFGERGGLCPEGGRTEGAMFSDHVVLARCGDDEAYDEGSIVLELSAVVSPTTMATDPGS